MGASDINAWRRQNSDPVAVEITLTDGTAMKGNVLVPRDKTLREVFNGQDPFLEFDCQQLGTMVLAKTAVRTARSLDIPKADQLEKRLGILERANAFDILGVDKAARYEAVRAAYIHRARIYHPDRYGGTNLPPEIVQYINAMARRINAAYDELSSLLGGDKADKGVAA